GSEYHLRVSRHLVESRIWADHGHEVAWEQFEMPWKVPARPVPDADELPGVMSVENDATIVVKGKSFSATIDLRTGILTSLVYDGREMIHDGRGPALDVYRALTDNDNWFRGAFTKADLDDLEFTAEKPRVESTRGATRVTVDGTVRGGDTVRFEVRTTYSILGTGEVVIDTDVTPGADLPPLPKIGLTMRVPAAYETFTWFGRGPHESYPDRKRGAEIGRYASTVTDQFVDYVRPQEHGNLTDVRWAALTDGEGRGLLVVLDGTMNVSASHYDPRDLEASRHRNRQPARRIPLVSRPEVILDLDARQMGLGGASCGPRPMAKYILNPERISFRVSLRRWDEDAWRPAVPVVAAPRIERDRMARLSMKCATPGATIAYTLDGSVPGTLSRRFVRPFFHAGAGEVQVEATATGMLRSPVTRLVLEATEVWLDVPKAAWRVVDFDSEQPGEGWAKHAIDGDPGTFWHTNWQTTKEPFPHHLTVDFGETLTLHGIALLPRQGSKNVWSSAC
ncbi:MAG: discoidin domain-containing protein, partial [Planctomycetota bacterium]